MDNVIIYAHPNPKSFNSAIRKTIEEKLKEKDENYTVRDLYQLNFNPVMKPEDFIAIQHGDFLPDVKKEQTFIKNAKRIFIIHPIWWYSMPAILKGYIDRVFSHGFAYDVKNGKIERLLTGKEVVIFNTMGESKKQCEESKVCFCIRKTIDSIFEFCGMNVVHHKIFFSVPYVSDKERKGMLEEVKQIVDNVLKK